MGNGESQRRFCETGVEQTNRAFHHSRFPNPVTQAARRSDSVSDSMLAALGLTSQNLPM